MQAAPLHADANFERLGWNLGKVYAGTSGWAYATWKPDFYPAKLASAKFLGHYASRLNTVEVNYTFRRFPTEKLLRGWLDADAGGFQICVQGESEDHAHQAAEGCGGIYGGVCDGVAADGCGGEAGAGAVSVAALFEVRCGGAEGIFVWVPRGLKSAFEFRHASWFCDEVYDVMREANVALCMAESEKLETPDVQTADFAYLRLRKEDYSEKAQAAVKERVEKLAAAGDVFVYFKHEDTPEGALHAEKLLNEMLR